MKKTSMKNMEVRGQIRILTAKPSKAETLGDCLEAG